MICQICKQEKEPTSFLKHWELCIPCNRRLRVRSKERDRKRLMLRLMGGCCSKCGYKKCASALELHHVDPREKDFTWSKLRTRKWETVLNEIQKCILLCANCHREEHATEDSFDLKSSGNSNPFLDHPKRPIKNPRVMPTGTCPTCQSNVFGTKYCSVKCARIGAFRDKGKRPPKYKLKKLLSTCSTQEIADLHGVSYNAVRKWIKKYSLEDDVLHKLCTLKDKNCSVCGALFHERKLSQEFCSLTCYRRSLRQKSKNPGKEKLLKLIGEHKSILKASRSLNCPYRTVRGWLSAMGLPDNYRDLRVHLTISDSRV